MAKRVILGGLLGGVALFFWGAVAHMLTPLGATGFSRLPVDREDALRASMKAAVTADGMYLYPGADMNKPMTTSEEAVWTAKLKDGPSGLLLIRTGAVEPGMSRQLMTEFGTNVVSAVLAGLLLAATRLRFAGRVGFVTLLGLFATLTVNVPYWNWYGFRTDFTAAALIEHVVGWLIVGLVLGAIVKHPAPAESSFA